MASYLRDYLASAVSQSLQEYFDGVSQEVVSVALWGGDLELEKLTVRDSVLEDLKLPVAIRKVTVAKLSAKVPWGSFGMRPVILTLSGVHLEAEPLDVGWDWTREQVAAYELAAKLREVSKQIAQIERQAALSSSWLSGITARFLESTQVRVQDIALQFIDRTSNPRRTFCVGVLLESLSYGTCDPQSLSSKTSEDTGFAPGRFTCLDLSNFCVFWDHELPEPTGAHVSRREHDYVLHPTSGTVIVEICQADSNSEAQRSFFADLSLQRLAVTMSDVQIEDLSHLLRKHDELEEHRFVVLHRPSVSVLENPRAWWRYAVACVRRILPKDNKKDSGVGVGRLLQLRREYCAAYDAHLDSIDSATLSSNEGEEQRLKAQEDQRSILAELDRSLPVRTLVAFRRTVRVQRSLLRDRTAAVREREDIGFSSTWMGWFGLAGSPADEKDSTPRELDITSTTVSDQRTVLTKLFGDDGRAKGTVASSTDHKKHSRKCVISILSVLNEGFVSLKVKSRELVQIIFDGLHRLRVFEESWDSTLVLGGFQVIDLAAKDTCLPSIVLPKPTAESPMVKIGDFLVPKSLEFKLRHNPENVRGRQDVDVDLQVFPFELVYSAPCIQAFVQFAGSSQVSRVSSGLGQSIRAFRKSQTKAIVQAIEARSRVRFSAKIGGSKLLVPVDIRDESRAVVLVDLGDTVVTTNAQPLSDREYPCERRIERRFQHQVALEEGTGFGESWQARVSDLSVVHFINLRTYQSTARIHGHESQAKSARSIVEHFAIDFTVKVHVPASASATGHVLLSCSLPALKGHLSPDVFYDLKSIDFGTGYDHSSFDVDVIDQESTLPHDRSFGALHQVSTAHGDHSGSERPWLYEARIKLSDLVVSVKEAQRGEMVIVEGKDGLDSELTVIQLKGVEMEIERHSTNSKLQACSPEISAVPQTESTIVRYFLTSCTVFDCYNKVLVDSPEDRASMGFSTLLRCTGEEDANGSDEERFVSVEIFDENVALTSIDLRMGSCQINWNPETLIKLVEFFVHTEVASRSEEAYSHHESKLELPMSREGTGSSTVWYEQTASKRTVLVAHVQRIGIRYNKEHLGQNVAATTVTGFKCHARIDAVSSALSGELGNFTLQDLSTPNTLYPELIGLMDGVQDSLVKFKFTYDSSAQDRGEPAYSVALTLSPMRFVFILQLTLELLDYAYEGVLAVLSAQTGGNEENSGTASVVATVDNDDDLMFGSLHMKIRNPVLLLPVSYYCEDFFTVDFGVVSIHNCYREENMEMHVRPPTAEDTPKSVSVLANVFQISAPDLSIVTSSGRKATTTGLTLELLWCVESLAQMPCPGTVCRGSFSPFTLSFCETEYLSFMHFLFDNICGEYRQLMFQHKTLAAYRDWQGWTPPKYQYAEGENTTYSIELFTPELRLQLRDSVDEAVLIGKAVGRKTSWKLHRLHPGADTIMELLMVSVDLDGYRHGRTSDVSGTSSSFPLLRSMCTSLDVPELHITSRMPDLGLYEYCVAIRNLWLWIELLPWQQMFDILIMYQYSPTIPDEYQHTEPAVNETVEVERDTSSDLSTWTFELLLEQPHLVICPQGVPGEGYILRADTRLKMDYYNLDASISNGEFCRVFSGDSNTCEARSVLNLSSGPSILDPTTCAVQIRYAISGAENLEIPERVLSDPCAGAAVAVRPDQNRTLLDIGPLLISLSYSDIRLLDRIVESILLVPVAQANDTDGTTHSRTDLSRNPGTQQNNAANEMGQSDMLNPGAIFDEEWGRKLNSGPPDSSKVVFRALVLTFVDDTCVRFEAPQPLLRIEARPVVCLLEETGDAEEGYPMLRTCLQIGDLGIIDLLIDQRSDFRKLLALSCTPGYVQEEHKSGEDSQATPNKSPEFGMYSMNFVSRKAPNVSVVDMTLRTAGLNWNSNTLVALKEITLRYMLERNAASKGNGTAVDQKTQVHGAEVIDEATEARVPAVCSGLTLRIDELYAILNKESQDRRLLHAVAREIGLDVRLNLCRGGGTEGSARSFSDRSVGSKMSCTVRSIQARDLCSPTLVYPFVVACQAEIPDPSKVGEINEDSMLHIEYEDWGVLDSEEPPIVRKHSERLHVFVAPIRFVYYQEFTMELVDYLLAQQIILGIDDRSDDLDNTLSDSEEGVVEGNAFPFGASLASNPVGDIDIRIGSPEIVLPPTSSAKEHLLVNVGAFSLRKTPSEYVCPAMPANVSNRLSSAEREDAESIKLRLSGTEVFSRFGDEDSRRESEGVSGRQLLQVCADVHLSCASETIGLHTRKTQASVLSWRLDGQIPEIEVNLREDDFALVRDVLDNNVLSGTIHGMELLILRSLTTSLNALGQHSVRERVPETGAPSETRATEDRSLKHCGESFQPPRVKSSANLVRFSYGRRASAQETSRGADQVADGSRDGDAAEIHAGVTLSKLSVCLLSGTGHRTNTETLDNAEPLLKLALEEVSFAYASDVDRVVNCTCSVKSLSARDSRTSVSRPFRQIVAMVPKASDDREDDPQSSHQMFYNFQSGPSGDSDSAFVLRSLRVFILSEMVALVQKFVSGTYAKAQERTGTPHTKEASNGESLLTTLGVQYDAFHGALTNLGSDAAWEHRVVIPDVPSTLVKDSRAKLLLHNVEILFLEKPFEEVTRAICVRSFVHSTLRMRSSLNAWEAVDGAPHLEHDLPTLTREANLHLTQLQVDVLPMLSSGIKMTPHTDEPKILMPELSILSPVDFFLDLTAVSAPSENMRLLGRLRTGDINLEVSYRDVYLFMTLLRSMQEFTADVFSEDRDRGVGEAFDNVNNRLMRAHSDDIDRFSEDTDGLPDASVYDVTFYGDKLGIVFAKHGNLLVVDSFDESSVLSSAQVDLDDPNAEHDPIHSLRVGDVLVALQGDSVLRVSYETSISLIRTLSRPVTLSFQRNVDAIQTSRGFENSIGQSASPAIVVRLEAPSKLFERCLGVSESQRGLYVKCAYLINNLFIRKRNDMNVLEEGSKLAWVNDEYVADRKASDALTLLQSTGYPVILRFRSRQEPETRLRLHTDYDSIAVTFLDDSEGRQMPLVRFNIDGKTVYDKDVDLDPKFLCPIDGDGDDRRPCFMQMTGDVRASVSYYNPNIGMWEPLLEEMEIFFTTEMRSDIEHSIGVESKSSRLREEAASRGPSQWAVSITSLGPVNVNVTEAWTLHFASFLKRWHQGSVRESVAPYLQHWGMSAGSTEESDSAAVPGGASTFSPVYIQNLTGLGIEVYRHDEKKHELFQHRGRPLLVLDALLDSNKEPVPLPVSFGLARTEGFGLRRDYDSLPTLDLVIEGYQKVERLGLGLSGRFKYDVQRRAAETTDAIVWQLEVVDGRKIVVVRSPLGFRNCLAVGVEIKACSPTEDVIFATLQPGDTCYLPVPYERAHNYLIRPEGSPRFSWPIFDEMEATGEIPDHGTTFRLALDRVFSLRNFVACESADESADSSFVFLKSSHPDERSDGLAKATRADLLVHLFASVVVRNNLLEEASVAVWSAGKASGTSDGILVRKTLAHEEIMHLNTANAALDQLRLMVNIRGMSSAEWVNLQSGTTDGKSEPARKTKRMIVQDGQGNLFAFGVTWETNASSDGLQAVQSKRKRRRQGLGAAPTMSTSMPHRIKVTLYPEFILENLTGINLIFGQEHFALDRKRSARGPTESAASARKRLRRQRLRYLGVRMNPWQPGLVEEELFEVSILNTPESGTQSGSGLNPAGWRMFFCSETGEPLPGPDAFQLPSSDWEWIEDKWEVDTVGLSNSDGWESRRAHELEVGVKEKQPRHGLQIEPSKWFGTRSKPEVRMFDPRHNLRRRRWYRHRHRVKRSASDEATKAVAMASAPTNQELLRFIEDAAEDSRNENEGSPIGLDLKWPSMEISPEESEPLPDLVAFRVRVAGGGYSNSINVTADGTDGAIECPNATTADGHRSFQLAYRVRALEHTKITTIENRFILVNKTRAHLVWKDSGILNGMQSTIPSASSGAIHAESVCISFAANPRGLKEDCWMWSGAIDLSELWTFPLRVRRTPPLEGLYEQPANWERPWKILRLSSRLNLSTKRSTPGAILVTVSEEGESAGGWGENPIRYSGSAPTTEDALLSTAVQDSLGEAGKGKDLCSAMYILQNTTNLPVWYAQESGNVQHCLNPQEMVAFGWDDPRQHNPGARSQDQSSETKPSGNPSLRLRASLLPLAGPMKGRDLPVSASSATEQNKPSSPSTTLARAKMERGFAMVSKSRGARDRVFASPTRNRFEKSINLERIGKTVRLPNPGRSPTSETSETSETFLDGSPLRERQPSAVYADVTVRGASKIVRFSVSRRHGKRNNRFRMALSDNADESQVPVLHPIGALTVQIPTMHISIVDNVPREIALCTFSRLRCEMITNTEESRTSVRAANVQVDNFLPYCSFPVMIALRDRSPAERSSSKALKIALSVLRSGSSSQSYVHVRQFSFVMGELDVRLDSALVSTLLEFSKRQAGIWEEAFPSEDELTNGEATTLKYFELLQIDRVRISMSYKNTGANRVRGASRKMIPVLTSALIDMVGRLDGARIRLKPIVLKDFFGSLDVLSDHICQHYEREAKRHVFELIGALHLLGNPIGLIRSFRDGAKDFVAEPMLGLMDSIEQAKPAALVKGFKKGTTSLLKNSVGGVVNSASLLTDMLSNQVSNLTMDQGDRRKHKTRREENERQNANVLQGLGAGTRSFARSLFEGVSGVVSKPIEGAKSGGAAGLVKGLGHGVVGLVAKPVVGISDAATDVLRGVKGSVDTLNGQKPLEHMRPPRAIFGPGRQLRPYSKADAEAKLLFFRLLDISSSDEYDAGLDYNGFVETGVGILLLSVSSILGVHPNGSIVFTVALKTVFVVEIVDRSSDGTQRSNEAKYGVILHIESQKGSRPANAERSGNVFVPCDSSARASAVHEKLSRVVQEYRCAQHNVLIALD